MERGGGISNLVSYLQYFGIEIKEILDCDIQKEGKKILDKVFVRYPDHLTYRYDSDKTIAIINTSYFKGIEQYEIVCLLNRVGIIKFYELSKNEKKEIAAKPHPWVDIGRIEYYREHVKELEDIYNKLYDEKSKNVMLEFIRAYMEYGTYSLKQCSSDLKYFYGQNDDGMREELYKHKKEEVWINCGSNNGDNIFWYFANGLEAKKIYAYEANHELYARLIKNLQYLPKKYVDKIYPVNEFIDDKTNWEKLRENNVTLINADIEGGELDLLKSMTKLIVCSRPVLAICVYHKASDLVEIPRYIKQIVDNYCFVLRKYESGVEIIRRTAELVLYAIPKERVSDKLL